MLCYVMLCYAMWCNITASNVREELGEFQVKPETRGIHVFYISKRNQRVLYFYVCALPWIDKWGFIFEFWKAKRKRRERNTNWLGFCRVEMEIQSPLNPRHPRLWHPRLYAIVLVSPNFNPFISLLKFPATKAPCNKANPPLRHSNDGPLGGFNPPLRHLLCFFLKSVQKSNFTFLKFFEKIF